jgi:hypothetical protein
VAALLLAYKADVNVRSNGGATPLVSAAIFCHEDVAELLISSGADVNAKTNAGVSPLIAVAPTGCVAVAKLLLADNADVNFEDSNGWTALHSILVSPFKWGDRDGMIALLRERGGIDRPFGQPVMQSGGAASSTAPGSPVTTSNQTPAEPSAAHGVVSGLTNDQISAAIRRGIDDKLGPFVFADRAYNIEVRKGGLYLNIVVLSDSDRIAMAASSASHQSGPHGKWMQKPNFSFSPQDALASAVRTGVVTVVIHESVSGMYCSGTPDLMKWVGPLGATGYGEGPQVMLTADGEMVPPMTNGQYFSLAIGTAPWRSTNYFKPAGPCAAYLFNRTFPVIEGVEKLTLILVGSNGERIEKKVDPKRFMAR